MDTEVDFTKLAEELDHLSSSDKLAFAEFLYRNNRSTAQDIAHSIAVAELEDLFDNVPV